MSKIIEQGSPLNVYSNLDYTRGLNAALSRQGESIINMFMGIGVAGKRVEPVHTTIARLVLPRDKTYEGDPFAQPYAGDFLLDVVDIDMPKPRHARQLASFVQRVRLGLTATDGEGDSPKKIQDFHVNDEGLLFAGGGLRLWLYPDVEVGYIPVQNGSAEPPASPSAAVLAPLPSLPSLETGAELLRV